MFGSAVLLARTSSRTDLQIGIIYLIPSDSSKVPVKTKDNNQKEKVRFPNRIHMF